MFPEEKYVFRGPGLALKKGSGLFSLSANFFPLFSVY